MLDPAKLLLAPAKLILDPANLWLVEQLKASPAGNKLWFVDENYSQNDLSFLSDGALANQQHLQIISNRSDLTNQLLKLNLNAQFSDFDTSSIADHSVDYIFYRVSKEKNLTHHLINLATKLLKQKGLLYLVGYKQEGIKTYIEKANQLFGASQKVTKQGPCYVATLPLNQLADTQLPTDDYTQVRTTFPLGQQNIYSKPGQFGWNKIDQGSVLLIEQLHQYIKHRNLYFKHCLDLGCGYGYLSIAAAWFSMSEELSMSAELSISEELRISEFTLTDNNAAALQCAKINMAQFPVKTQVCASDAATELTGDFDLILCNPPFHKGFSVDTDLTEKFLSNTTRLLRPNGKAFYVVNQFIPLEAKAEGKGFSRIETLSRESGFKVILLEKNSE